ncbi:HTH-type transcriptional regulator ArgP [Orrella daihaiensis]|uniref:HTH-type transcriptional regulator ArgP n=1 Tax=Orrella daihaiensis TaxID=2782176 RepID=A0ABY4AMZ2_9BURK|nr:HTH-type transcriptional regulator ArgP [Orrella daihaiensis]UOD50437.1 HTH-type transcriptional regulator ArgP [Orrella daihaiensis]
MIEDKLAKSLFTVVNEGSFQAAARVLNLTPAAVTQRIKALEAQIGARVLVRGKQLRLTPQGKAIVAFHHKNELLQDELLRALNLDAQTYHGNKRWRTLRVAVNADSIASWFLPGVADALGQQHLLLDVVIDDQDHTHEALRTGEVMGCVTTLAEAMPGCVAEPLGVMRYRALATSEIMTRVQTSAGRLSAHRLLAQPAVIFNRKDAIHDRFLERFLKLQSPAYPKHFVPALDAFEAAIDLGLGWGLVPDAVRASPSGKKPTAKLQEVMPGCYLDVQLYWQHWQQEPRHAAALTQAVKAAAMASLLQADD